MLAVTGDVTHTLVQTVGIQVQLLLDVHHGLLLVLLHVLVVLNAVREVRRGKLCGGGGFYHLLADQEQRRGFLSRNNIDRLYRALLLQGLWSGMK